MNSTPACKKFYDSLRRFMSNMGSEIPIKVIEDTDTEICLSIGAEYMVQFTVSEDFFSLYKLCHDAGTYWDPPTTEEIHLLSHDDHVLVFEALGNHLVKDAVKYQREVEFDDEYFPKLQ